MMDIWVRPVDIEVIVPHSDGWYTEENRVVNFFMRKPLLECD